MTSKALQRSLALATLLTGMIGAGALAFRPGEEIAADYRLATVEQGRLIQTVTASGTLNAEILVQVGAQVTGRIVEILADFNTPVTQGQVVARLDPAQMEGRVAEAVADVAVARAAVVTQEAQVARASADLENARAETGVVRAQGERARVNAEEAERDFQRRDGLVARGVVAASDRDRARTARDAARATVASERAQQQAQAAQVRSAEAQLRIAEAQVANAEAQVLQKEAALRRAQIDLENTIIRSPVDGVVISRNVDVGQTVAASLQAPVLFTIARDLRRMQVEVSVDEADVGRVAKGQQARFSVDAFPGEKFTGRISQVRKAANTVQNVVTYTVVVRTENPGLKLVPGMTATVRMLIAEKTGVARLPNAALRWRPAGTAPAARGTRVWILEDGRPVPVEVSTGIGDGSFTEILGGVSPGQSVIVGGSGPKTAAATRPL